MSPKATPWVPEERVCRCGAVFMPSTSLQVYCTPQHSPSWTRNKKPRDREGRSGHAWRKLRVQVLAEETRCWLCGFEVDQTLDRFDPGAPWVDHVVPIYAGGAKMDRANLRLAHRQCNQGRKRRVSSVW